MSESYPKSVTIFLMFHIHILYVIHPVTIWLVHMKTVLKVMSIVKLHTRAGQCCDV
jgi:hypothetical protein